MTLNRELESFLPRCSKATACPWKRLRHTHRINRNRITVIDVAYNVTSGRTIRVLRTRVCRSRRGASGVNCSEEQQDVLTVRARFARRRSVSDGAPEEKLAYARAQRRSRAQQRDASTVRATGERRAKARINTEGEKEQKGDKRKREIVHRLERCCVGPSTPVLLLVIHAVREPAERSHVTHVHSHFSLHCFIVRGRAFSFCPRAEKENRTVPRPSDRKGRGKTSREREREEGGKS